ncbi:MAG: nucleotidyl transferase AbiEii/AbiGii toxin family protein [Thermoanaerobaculia bacterium]
MSPTKIQNLPASVRQRLLNLAKQRREDFQFVLTRFTLERLLYRLSASRHADRFLLKGAMLLSVWSEEIYRPTRDLDLAGRGEISPDQIAMIFRDLCGVEDCGDGLIFDPDSIKVERIAELQQYPGLRIQMRAELAAAIIPVQVDIGFGDAITPGPVKIAYPTLLGHPTPRLRGYPRETVIAEKFQAMVHLGMANTRMRDFYDLWVLAQTFDFAGAVLAEAIRATFERRQTQIPSEVPTALTTEFESDQRKKADWTSFLRRTGKVHEAPELPRVCALLREFLIPLCRALASGDPFEPTWMAPGPWRTS